MKSIQNVRFSIAIGLAIGISLLTSCATTSLLEQKEGLPFVGGFKVNRYVLKNGLRVLILEDHTSPTFAYHTWMNVGSRDEDPNRTGLAHLFEHMMFKKTKNLKDGEFDRKLEEVGVEGKNAFTSRDYTAYIQQLPKEHLELIVQLESDRFQNLVVDEKAFRTETQVVLNERKMRNDNSPGGMIYEKLFETAYAKHPYRWPVIGYQKHLDAMKGTDAYAFYRKFYSPGKATIVVVGDVSPSHTIELIDKYYGKIKGTPNLPKHLTDPKGLKADANVEPEQKTVRRKRLNLPIKVERVVTSFHVPGINSKEAATFEVLQSILSGGKSGRLRRALVDTGIAVSAWAGSYQHRDPTLFIFDVTLQKGKRAAAAENVISRELNKLGKRKVTDRELTKAKNLLRFDLIDQLSSNYAKARFLGQFETVSNNYQRGLEIQNQIAAVRAEDIQDVVKKYFSKNKRTIIRGVPK